MARHRGERYNHQIEDTYQATTAMEMGVEMGVGVEPVGG